VGRPVQGEFLRVQPPRIKVCCISSAGEAELAIAAGASALGLVSAMPSGPGVIGEDLIAEIAARVPPPIATFLLTCHDRADAIAEQHSRCRTSTLQLVDFVEPAELRKLRKLVPGVKLVQVIHVRDEAAVEEARAVDPLVDAILLDSGNPGLAVKELGGTGRVHDWQVSAKLCAAVAKPVFLAGGLNAANVAQAIAIVRPYGVDLCSGVRTSGALDAAKLAAFMAAVRSTAIPGGPAQELGLVSVVVRDYEEALAFYVGVLGFTLVEDSPVPEQGKRWVVVAPPGGSGSRLLIARASTPEQGTRVGNQTGGRVFLFLYTDDFARDYERYRSRGVEFVRPPRDEPYGIVAVFRDAFGNLWDLVERKKGP
jgi:phosphoribosylanthranilate isomerase